MEYVDAALSYISAVPEKTEPQRHNGLVPHSGRDGVWASDGLDAALEAMRTVVDSGSLISTNGASTSRKMGYIDPDVGRVLSLMRQDMAAFGKIKGESELSLQKAERMRPVEFYA